MRLFLTSTLLFLATIGYGQSHNNPSFGVFDHFSFQIDRQSSGSGHLNFTAMGASFHKGRSTIYAGAILEDRNRNFKGLKLSYRFFPIAFGSRMHPYFQYDLLSRWNSRLNPEMERIVHHEGWNGERHERYRTVEHYLGFGVQAPLLADLYLDLGVGLGFYHSKLTSDFDDRIEEPGRFRRKKDASLSLRAGIGYGF